MRLVLLLFCCFSALGFAQSGPYQRGIGQARELIEQGQLGEAQRRINTMYEAAKKEPEGFETWIGQLHLAQAYLYFALDPTNEKLIRDRLGWAQSELGRDSETGAAYADTWLLQLKLNAKHRDYNSVVQQLVELVRLAEYHQADDVALSALLFAADFEERYGNPIRAIEYLRHASVISEKLNDSRANAQLNIGYANFYTRALMPERALPLITEAQNYFEENGPDRSVIQAILSRAKALSAKGELQQAIALLQEVATLAEAGSYPELQLLSASALSEILLEQGQFADAEIYLAIGSALATSVRERYLFTRFAAEHALALGRLEEAERLIADAAVLVAQLPTSAKSSFKGQHLFKLQGELAARRGDAKASFEAMRAYVDGVESILKQGLLDGVGSLLVEMEFDRVESRNQSLQNRNQAYREQLNAAEERERLRSVITTLSVLLALTFFGLGVYLLWQRGKLTHLAETDSLTGLHNRRTATQSIEAWLQDKRIPELSLILFDIDHFKRINDTKGHGCGDQVLKRVAELAVGQCRDSDLVARFGGEEFLIALPGCELANAQRVAEKIRNTFERSSFPGSLRVTASFGVASGHEVEFNRLYDAVDGALYKAKEQRNCVSIDPDSPFMPAPVEKDPSD